jgi:lipopolysaccharide heptosyltransferase II
LINEQINNILIIRLSSLGDILLTTPTIKALKQNFKNAKIDFVIRKEYSDALFYNMNISKLYYYQNDISSELRQNLKENQYDLIIDLQNNHRSRALIRGTKSKVLSFKKPTIRKLLLVWFKINLFNEGKTIIQRYEEAAGVDLESEKPELIIPDTVRPTLEDGRKYIGFCPGSRHFTKCWLPEYFVELGKMLAQMGIIVVIFGGRSDKEICALISKNIPGSINLQNEDNLLQTAAEMKKCRILITNDSGLMHTATAVNVPVAAIFGSTVKEFGFAPSGSDNLILENKSLSCRPCSHIGKSACPQGHFKCMKEIKAGDVLNKIKTFTE